MCGHMGLEFIKASAGVVLGSAIFPVVSKGMDSVKKNGRTETLPSRSIDSGIDTNEFPNRLNRSRVYT